MCLPIVDGNALFLNSKGEKNQATTQQCKYDRQQRVPVLEDNFSYETDWLCSRPGAYQNASRMSSMNADDIAVHNVL